ncbi:MAG: 23S rRNA (guanosine(2251)-2'-O)-methyltransferase RlmB [Magnetospirillum sp.]|nr:23S rRNA (guanosine(2251)-2'-O)-methyltransferase RlmB [Magnetospirillum sp.]
MATRDSRDKTRALREKNRPATGKPGGAKPADSRPEGRQDGRGDRERNQDRGQRPPGNQFWLYGHHAVLAALDNPRRKIRRLVLTADSASHWAAELSAARLRRPLPADDIVDKQEMERLLPPNAVHQGIGALTEPLPGQTLEEIARTAADLKHAVVMVLDQVTDPHNVGAILRSAAAFGALAVIVPDRHSPEETGALAKSASGALERMPLVRVTNVVRALDDLKAAGFWVAGMAGEATQTLASQKLSGRIALVMGAEGEGLRRLTREHCDYLVKLPMTGEVESLNVSNAAAVALYELVRERGLE